ncbi:hypothetical protein [Amycolatopsis sp. NPDC004079]|uniref:hypothetical protein n=1 Tax=Amycolatopsis sp. NPDC004079 TaxID=3154549 RepID=UPI0033AEB568
MTSVADRESEAHEVLACSGERLSALLRRAQTFPANLPVPEIRAPRDRRGIHAAVTAVRGNLSVGAAFRAPAWVVAHTSRRYAEFVTLVHEAIQRWHGLLASAAAHVDGPARDSLSALQRNADRLDEAIAAVDAKLAETS